MNLATLIISYEYMLFLFFTNYRFRYSEFIAII